MRTIRFPFKDSPMPRYQRVPYDHPGAHGTLIYLGARRLAHRWLFVLGSHHSKKYGYWCEITVYTPGSRYSHKLRLWKLLIDLWW